MEEEEVKVENGVFKGYDEGVGNEIARSANLDLQNEDDMGLKKSNKEFDHMVGKDGSIGIINGTEGIKADEKKDDQFVCGFEEEKEENPTLENSEVEEMVSNLRGLVKSLRDECNLIQTTIGSVYGGVLKMTQGEILEQMNKHLNFKSEQDRKRSSFLKPHIESLSLLNPITSTNTSTNATTEDADDDDNDGQTNKAMLQIVSDLRRLKKSLEGEYRLTEGMIGRVHGGVLQMTQEEIVLQMTKHLSFKIEQEKRRTSFLATQIENTSLWNPTSSTTTNDGADNDDGQFNKSETSGVQERDEESHQLVGSRRIADGTKVEGRVSDNEVPEDVTQDDQEK